MLGLIKRSFTWGHHWEATNQMTFATKWESDPWSCVTVYEQTLVWCESCVAVTSLPEILEWK